MKKNKLLILKLVFFFGGLYIASMGKVLLIESGFGVDPWTVFHLGLSYKMPFTVGQITQIVGAVMIVSSWALKIPPTIGTFLNMYFFGLFLDINIGLNFFKSSQNLVVSIIYLVIGILLNGFGLGVYINANLGAGPRDNLMLGLSKAISKTPGIIRTFMESAVLIAGWLLGGPVGLGTVVYALLIGSIMQWTLERIKLPEKTKSKDSSVSS